MWLRSAGVFDRNNRFHRELRHVNSRIELLPDDKSKFQLHYPLEAGRESWSSGQRSSLCWDSPAKSRRGKHSLDSDIGLWPTLLGSEKSAPTGPAVVNGSLPTDLQCHSRVGRKSLIDREGSGLWSVAGLERSGNHCRHNEHIFICLVRYPNLLSNWIEIQDPDNALLPWRV